MVAIREQRKYNLLLFFNFGLQLEEQFPIYISIFDNENINEFRIQTLFKKKNNRKFVA